MSESTHDTPPQPICPHCGAKQFGPARACWLCEKPLGNSNLGEPASAGGDAGTNAPHPPAEAGSPDVRSPEAHPERFHFSLATLLLIMTLASVAMGLLVTVPGLGIFACILMIPVFVRTMSVVRQREARGREVSAVEKITLFLGSFAVATVITGVACIAAFCSFCGVCATMFAFGGGGSSNEVLPIAIMTIIGAIASILALVALVRWNRRRYRREIGEE